MKRYLIIIMATILSGPLFAQYSDFNDAARYGQMNLEGVWAVGVNVEPAVGLSHPIGSEYGGGRLTGVGTFGFGVEGSYFIVDNMSLKASLGYVSNAWGNAFSPYFYDAKTTLSAFKFRLGAHVHFGRWSVGGGLALGNTAMNYTSADLSQGGTNDIRFGTESFRDGSSTLGLFYEGDYMLTPFLKAGLFYEPAITLSGGRYTHTFGARLTIYLPFVDAVVCK